jgi:alpha-glucosidase
VVSKRADYLAKTNGTRSFPWRVMLIARKDIDLPAKDLVCRLASPGTIKETDWIHPGKCTDEWIIDINLFNVTFKTGITLFPISRADMFYGRPVLLRLK